MHKIIFKKYLPEINRFKFTASRFKLVEIIFFSMFVWSTNFLNISYKSVDNQGGTAV